MESVYLGLFQRVLNWVFDRILDPVYRFVSGLLTTVLNWVFREILAPILMPILEEALKFFINLWMEIYSTKLYLLFSGILKIIDYLEKAFDVFIGLEEVTYTPPEAGATVIKGSLVEVLMQQKTISTVFWLITCGALGLALVLTIYGVAKSAFDLDFENKRPVSKVLAAMMKTFIQFFTVPFLVYFMLRLSTEILKGVTNALNFGNTTSLGRIVFVIASLNAAKNNNFNINSEAAKDMILGTSSSDTVRFPFYTLSSGNGVTVKDYGDIGQVTEVFRLADFDYLIGFIAAIFLLFTIGVCLIIFVQRIFELMLLYIVSPYFVCMIPLDDGEKFSKWREMFIAKCFTGFGSVVGMRLFLMICPMVMGNRIRFGTATSPEMDYMMKLFFLAGGAWAMYKSGSMITSLLSYQAGMSEANTAAIAGGMLYSHTIGMAMAKGQQAFHSVLSGRGRGGGGKALGAGNNNGRPQQEAGKFNGPSKQASTWKAAYPAGMKRSGSTWKSATPTALSNSRSTWKSASPSVLSGSKSTWKSATPTALTGSRSAWKSASPTALSGTKSTWKSAAPTGLSTSSASWKSASPQINAGNGLRGNGITIGAGRGGKENGSFQVNARGSRLTVNSGGSVVSRQFSRGQITIGVGRSIKPESGTETSFTGKNRSGITIGANRNLGSGTNTNIDAGRSPASKITIGAGRSLQQDLAGAGRFTGRAGSTITRGDITIGAGRSFRTGDGKVSSTGSSSESSMERGRFTGGAKGTITRGQITIGAGRNYSAGTSNDSLVGRGTVTIGANRNYSAGGTASESGRYGSSPGTSNGSVGRGTVTIGANRNYSAGGTASESGRYGSSPGTSNGSSVDRGAVTIGANRNYSTGSTALGTSGSVGSTITRGNITIGSGRSFRTGDNSSGLGSSIGSESGRYGGNSVGREAITIGANRSYSGGNSTGSGGGRYGGSSGGMTSSVSYSSQKTFAPASVIPAVNKAEASSSGIKVGYSDLSIKGLQYRGQQGKAGKITRRNSI